MNSISVRNVDFSYPGTDRLILRGIDLEVDEGDFVCLLGQSGCGKSTLLRLLAGLERPTSGTIEVGGRMIEGTGFDRSMVFQDYGLFPWMSAGNNLVLALRQRFPERSKKELYVIAREALHDVGLKDDVFDKYPKELSGGMRQRCAIARSFSLNPPILLMDEPFGALDAVTRARLQDMVIRLWNNHEPRRTVFFVTHDVEEALLLGTKIFVLGQSPSRVIYTSKITPDMKVGRTDLFKNKKVEELRNDLILTINEDIERAAETSEQ